MKSNYMVGHYKKEDFEQCISLYSNARAYFKENGIDQWQDDEDYPGALSIAHDSEKNALYTVKSVDSKQVLACFMACVEVDETYTPPLVTGNWLTNGTKYGVLHRVAVRNDMKGTGLGKVIMDFIAKDAAMQGASSLRCDTHEHNASMNRLLMKSGFDVCGDMTLPGGAPRIAYEKML